jgi:hypothetical protein
VTKSTRPSDRNVSAKNARSRAQIDLFPFEHHKSVLERIAQLSPEERKALVFAAPAFTPERVA